MHDKTIQRVVIIELHFLFFVHVEFSETNGNQCYFSNLYILLYCISCICVVAKATFLIFLCVSQG